MSNFITNSGTDNLKKRLIELVNKSEELKFLVGFFYFSGISELYEGLKANSNAITKVLVGLSVDHYNFELIEFGEKTAMSDEEKIYRFLGSVKKSLNSENFDTKDFYEQVKFFIELIKNDKLIIRKTTKPNHAKLYLFKLEKEQVGKKELFITGSSNLTQAGLSTQNEFNVEIGDYGFSDTEKYFDELWADGVKITEYPEIKTKLIEVIEKETLVKEIAPFEAYCLVLKTYLDSIEQKAGSDDNIAKLFTDNGYTPYQYQMDAIKQAVGTINEQNGVIIADVVGLGKTLVACAVGNLLEKRGIIICPPGLMGDSRRKDSGWNKYKEQFKIQNWEICSDHDLENAGELIKKAKGIEVVIVDEAHRFRNQDTKNYDLLKNICRGKQVILLTATPFNNRPNDILSLISLFVIPKKSTITLDNNLVAQFATFNNAFKDLGDIKRHCNSSDEKKRKKAHDLYTKYFGEKTIDVKKIEQRSEYLARRIRNVIEPITIRRNRLDLLNHPDYKKEIKELSKVAEKPIEWFYHLDQQQSVFYSEILETYFGPAGEGLFKGAIYRPYEYKENIKDKRDKEQNQKYVQQRNLFDFMRRLLVKRFESSFGAFEQSIRNFKIISQKSQAFIEKTGEYVLDRALMEKIFIYDSEDIEKSLLEYEEKIIRGEYPKNHERYKISQFERKEEFLTDIQSDITMFDEILGKLAELKLVENDPKTKDLIENLDKEFAKVPLPGEPKRKIVIFSEYVDTVNYLRQTLEQHFGEKLLVVAGDLSHLKIDQINKNFDASYEKPEDKFDLLLSSDKISEGFNLNRAGMIINYDIPWNPVRVIQRLGRINRISKKVFNELYIVNYFPTEKGATLVQSREIAASKMYLIHTALGEDARIFNEEENPSPARFYQNMQKLPDEKEGENFQIKALVEFAKIRATYPELIAKLDSYPPRVKSAKNYEENELLVFYKKGRLYVGAAKTDAEKIEPYFASLEEVIERIRCTEKEPKADWNTDQFWNVYQKVKDYRDFSQQTINENSLESKARNNLDFLIKSKQEQIMLFKDFLRTLKEDINDCGTLSDYTLRRIANFKEDKPEGINELLQELGADYLTKEKGRLKEKEREIIIAIQNIK